MKGEQADSNEQDSSVRGEI